MDDQELLETLSAISEALTANAREERESRIQAVEEAILARIAAVPPERAGKILDGLEGRFPVRRSPAEEECIQLKKKLKALETRCRELDEELRRGGAEVVRSSLEKLSGTEGEGLEDPNKLAAILVVLTEVINKIIGYANVGMDRWEFKEGRYPQLEEMVSAHIGKSPEELARGLQKDLERIRNLLKAMIKADLQFTPNWCKSTQARFSPEAFSEGVSKAKAWDKYMEFLQAYSFSADLMQGLRTFIDGERQGSGS